jgi:hypothetical protein
MMARGTLLSLEVLHASRDEPSVVNLPTRQGQTGRDVTWIIQDVMTGQPVGQCLEVHVSTKRGDTRISHLK